MATATNLIKEKCSTIASNQSKIYDADGQNYIIVDSEGTEVLATLVDRETIFTATANDIREGTVAATEEGVTTGTKVIPSYHTTEAVTVIRPGSTFESAVLADLSLYDFTKLQAIICPFSQSLDNSVSAEKVVINEGVYVVNSTELLAAVKKDSETKRISLGITNDTDKIYLMRYFTYKEIN